MSSSFKVSVVTPEGSVLETTATSVVFPMHDGMAGVLNNHAPLLAEIGSGPLTITGETNAEYFVSGGFAQMRDNVLSLLCNRAVEKTKLDAAEARNELAEAEKMPIGTDAEFNDAQKAITAAKAKLAMAR